MALGELVRAVEEEYKEARQQETELERLVQEKKAELQEQAKRIAFKREANTAAAVRSKELATTAKALEKEVQIRRRSLRQYQIQTDALSMKILLQEEENAKDDERKVSEQRVLEKKLEANLDKYQAFPEAQKLANLELERNLLQRVTKLGRMKATNLEHGVGHGQGAFESSPEISTQKYREFCARFAEKSLEHGHRSPTIQVETDIDDTQNEKENHSPLAEQEDGPEPEKEATAHHELEGNGSPTVEVIQQEELNTEAEAEHEMQVDEVHTAPLDMGAPPAEQATTGEKAEEMVEEVAEAVNEETAEIQEEEIPIEEINKQPSQNQFVVPPVKMPFSKVRTINFPPVNTAQPKIPVNIGNNFPPVNISAVGPNTKKIPTFNFDMPTSTSRLNEKENVQVKEKPKEKPFNGFNIFGSASPSHSDASDESQDGNSFVFSLGLPKKNTAKPEDKNTAGISFGFGKQDDKKEKKKNPVFFLDF